MEKMLIRRVSEKPVPRSIINKKTGVETIQYVFLYRLNNEKNNRQITSTVSEKECMQKYLEKEIEVNKKGALLISSETFLYDFTKDYLENVKTTNAKFLIGSQNNLLIASREFKRINKKISDITILDIEKLFKELVFENKSDSYIKKVKQLLNNVLDRAVNLNILLRNDIDKAVISETHKEIKKVLALTISERAKFNKLIENEPFKNLFLFAIESGCRASEILALTYSDIDLNNRTANINKQVKWEKLDETYDNKMLALKKIKQIIKTTNENKAFKIYPPKTKSGVRTIILTDIAIKALIDQKALNIENNIKNEHNLFFCSGSGNYHFISNLNRDLKKVKEKGNFEQLSMHNLRHTTVTRLFELGFNYQEIAAQIGDRDIKTVKETYNQIQTEHLLNKKVEILDKMNKQGELQEKEIKEQKERDLKEMLEKVKRENTLTKKHKKTKKTTI